MDPSCLSVWQGPVQAFLRPAIWIPGMKNLRFHAEQWDCQDTTSQAFDLILDQCKDFREHRSLINATVVIHKQDKNQQFIELHTYTKAEWLDVVEIHLIPKTSGCSIRIRSWSSGFLPTIIPLAPLLNAAFCWFPFSGRDANGWVNSRRIRIIRESVVARGLKLA